MRDSERPVRSTSILARVLMSMLTPVPMVRASPLTCPRSQWSSRSRASQVSGEVFNIGTGVSMDIKTLAKMLVERTGRSESLIHYVDDRPGQVFRHTAD